MGENSLPVLPVPLKDMTRDSLRMFIPKLLNSHGVDGGKTRIGSDKAKQPPWWPDQVPFNSIRIDTRPDTIRNKMGWTDALRQVVRSCYQFYGGEHMLNPTIDAPNSPIKVVNNVDGSVSFITDKAVVTLEQLDKSKYAGGVHSRLDVSSLPTESSAVPLPSRVFQNLQASTSNKASVEMFVCKFCEKQFSRKSSLHTHHLYCSAQSLEKQTFPTKRKLKLIPVDELPRADKKAFISGLNLIPLSRARIMKKQQSKCKEIEITKIDSEEGMKSPTTPKTPKSLISQLSRDLSPPGKCSRRKSLISAFDNNEAEDKELSGSESVKSEIQKDENESKENIGNRSLLNIEVCSNLGSRVRKLMQQQAQQSMPSLSGEGQVNYEQFCHTPKKNEALSRLRIRNSEHSVTFRKTRKTCPKYAHQYKFTTSQRKEWYLTSVTGLNARSRELTKLVRKCHVTLKRVSQKLVDEHKRKAHSNVNISRLSGSPKSFLVNKSPQSLISGRIFTSPDGRHYLMPVSPVNFNNGAPRVVLPNLIMPQQQRILPKPTMNDKVKGNNQFNVIDLTPPATPEGKSPRPVQLVQHVNRQQQSVELQKLLQRPLKHRLEPSQPNSPVKRPFKAVAKNSQRKNGKLEKSNDVICISDEDDRSPSSKPPPAKRQKVENKKSNPTLLFKCHLCHAELTCCNNFSGYIESHFAEKHNVTNIQLVEHVDSRGQVVVSIVEKVAKKKADQHKAMISANNKPSNSTNTMKKTKVAKNNVANTSSSQLSKVNSSKSSASNNGRRRLNRNTSEVICID